MSAQQKAEGLVASRRCHAIACEPGRFWLGSVEARGGGAYLVTYVKIAALAESLFENDIPVPINASCTCEHAKHSTKPCSHMIAAALMLHDAPVPA